MPIDAILDNLESVPEPMRALYVKGEDGKHYLDINKDTITGHPVTAGLASAFGKTKEELQRAREYAKNFEGIPLDKVPQVKDMISKMDQEQYDKLVKSGDIKSLIQKELEPWREKATALEQQLMEKEAQINESKLDSWFRKEFARQFVDTGVQDAYIRLKGLFRVEAGQVKPVDETQTQGALELAKAKIKDLEKSAPHLFPQSAGPGLKNGSRDYTPHDDVMKLTPEQRINQGRRAAK